MASFKFKLKRKSRETTPKKNKTEYVSYQSFRLHKPIKGDKITGSFRLMGQAFQVLGRNWKLFGGIMFWYALLIVALTQGFQLVSNIQDTKDGITDMFSGWGELATGTSLFIYLLGSGGENATATTAAYQAILAIIFSLVLIWALRQVYAEEKGQIRIRDGFYLGMTPLITFLLVLVVVAIQLIPVIIGATLYSTVLTGGIATTAVEFILWGSILFVLALVSFYLIASSLFALYIVTLPEMTPVHALRSARELVRYRRWVVLRKIIFLPIALVVMSAIVLVPLILFVTPVAGFVLFAVTMILLPVAHSYMYALYRALL